MSSPTCRSCGASVYWLKHHETGKLAPIDAEPVPDGNIVIEGETYKILAKDLLALAEGFGDDIPRHKNHFATCPNAATHHKGPKR
jgi:hypothetical protein